MVEIDQKYEIGVRRFGLINWIGMISLFKKEVLRFLVVWVQTLFSPLITSLLFLLVLGHDIDTKMPKTRRTVAHFEKESSR